MSTISSAGIGSGLDVDSIVSALVAVERKPIENLQTQAETLQTKLSTYGKLKSYMSDLRDASSALARPATWAQTKASSSDEAAVKVTTGDQTLPGQYAIEVASLAAAQTVATTKTYTNDQALVGAGTLTIETGRWSGSSFGTPSSSFDVELTATDTLAGARDKINAAGGNVVAAIMNDSTGSRLVLRSRDTGADQGFRVSAVDGDGNNTDNSGISAMTYSGPSSATTALSQSASDAVATINNMTVRSSSNTLSNVIDGLTLTLYKATTIPVQVSATLNTDAMKESIQKFVNTYNELSKYLSAETGYNADTKVGGSLQGDSSAVSLRNQLRQMLSADSEASSMFKRLSDVGFDIQANGTINLKTAKLDNALSNVGELKKLFANADLTDDSKDGLMTQMRRMTDSYLGFDGALATRTESLQRRITDNSSQQARLEDRVSAVEKRLRAQYTSLDTRMGELSGISSYLTQQITLLNKG